MADLTDKTIHPMKIPWNFDQAPDVAAITTKMVLEEGAPVLRVVHYDDDHSWAFTCGTTNNPADGLVIAMGCILERDPTLHEIADLEPGWGAWREEIGGEWGIYPLDDG